MKRSQIHGWIAHCLLAETPGPPPRRFDWDAALREASAQSVTPALAERLKDADWLPASIADYLAAVLFLNRERNAQLAQGLTLAVGWFAQAGLSPLAIKGAGLIAARVLPDIGARVMGDLDIYPPGEAELETARAVLQREGFRLAAQANPVAHQLGMAEHPELGFGIELHRRMIGVRYAGALDEKGIYRRSVAEPLGGASIRVPVAQDRLTIAMAHALLHDRGAQFGTIGLRLLQDIALHRAMPGGGEHWGRAIKAAIRQNPRIYAPVASIVERACVLPESLPREMVAALDQPWRNWVKSGWQMLETTPHLWRMSWAERRAALSAERWQARIAYFFRR